MSGFTLAKTGKRYTRLEWMSMDPDEQAQLLARSGPAYTDEAWARHHGKRNARR